MFLLATACAASLCFQQSIELEWKGLDAALVDDRDESLRELLSAWSRKGELAALPGDWKTSPLDRSPAWMRLHLDLAGQLTPILGGELSGLATNWVGETLSFEVTAERERQQLSLRQVGRPHRASGLQREFLQAVPKDVAGCWLTSFSLEPLLQGTSGLWEGSLKELQACLGDQRGFYVSAPGPLGAATTTFLIELEDPKAWGAWAETALAAFERRWPEHSRDYVRFEQRELEQGRHDVITFPGLPVPFEAHLAAWNGWLVMAWNEVTLKEALLQLAGDRPSLLDNPRLELQGPGRPEELVGALALTWIDTPQLLPSGYGLLCLGFHALANQLREAGSSTPRAGRHLPTYAEFAAEARGILSWTEGDAGEWQTQVRMDRSLAVNLAAFASFLSSQSYLPTLWEVVRTIAQNQPDPREQVSRDLRSWQYELNRHAAMHDGTFPTSLGEITVAETRVKSLHLRDPWGIPYGYRPAPQGGRPELWCKSLQPWNASPRDPWDPAWVEQRQAKLAQDLDQLEAAMERYRAVMGVWPVSLEQLGWPTEQLVDPWGDAYRLDVQDQPPRVSSLNASR